MECSGDVLLSTQPLPYHMVYCESRKERGKLLLGIHDACLFVFYTLDLTCTGNARATDVATG